MKIEVHLIQNFAPSCLNRDDTNTPKDCVFGGVRRARISSQSYKRAIRQHFRSTGSVPVGERTKRLIDVLLGEHNDKLPAEVAARLDEILGALRADAAFAGAVESFVASNYAGTDGKTEGSTNVLLFLAPYEMEVAAHRLAADWDLLAPARKDFTERERLKAAGDTKGAEKIKIPVYKPHRDTIEALKGAKRSSDIALFGRMLADQPQLKIEAACQVAHPLSTHEVNPENDFFSAVDDLTQDQPGAGMLGIVGFNSACFYRYAVIDWESLVKNLHGDEAVAHKTVRAFLEAMVEAIPSGKQNSMAAQNRPDFGLFVVREKGQPMSLANAFVEPIRIDSSQSNGGLTRRSIDELSKYWSRLTKVYDDGAQASLFLVEDVTLSDALTPCDAGGYRAALDQTMKLVPGGATES